LYGGYTTISYVLTQVDVVKRTKMRQGVQLCKQAGELAIKSRDLVPDMPRVNAEKVCVQWRGREGGCQC
jgi:hypothetical protein